MNKHVMTFRVVRASLNGQVGTVLLDLRRVVHAPQVGPCQFLGRGIIRRCPKPFVGWVVTGPLLGIAYPFLRTQGRAGPCGRTAWLRGLGYIG